MTGHTRRRFLFIGNANTDAAVNKLKASAIPYAQKRLESNVHNWDVIRTLLDDEDLTGVIAKLTAQNYSRIVDPGYKATARSLFESLARRSHIVFVHEAVLMSEEPLAEEEALDRYGDTYVNYRIGLHRMSTPSREVVAEVNRVLEEYQLNVVPYRTNAELSVLSAAFLDENERNLLFRVYYVPAGRLYAAEADKLLGLFRDWLSQVGKHAVRQDGYTTAAGKVYEFFGDDSLPAQGLSAQFDDFSDFLTQCVDDPSAAKQHLRQLGLDPRTGSSLVQRYGKEVRRLHLDLRHDRESRILEIRHSLESELLDLASPPQVSKQIDRMIESMMPSATGAAGKALLAPLETGVPPGSVTVNIHQQIVHAVESTVVQNIQGTVHLGAEATDLIALAKQFGGGRALELESDVHELEDADARPADRLGARQRLKGFLIKLSSHVEAATLASLQTYLETKIGGLL